MDQGLIFVTPSCSWRHWAALNLGDSWMQNSGTTSLPDMAMPIHLATTFLLCPRVTLQTSRLPLHAPPHPVNREWGSGVAVKVTIAPLSKVALHVLPQ